MSESIFSPIDLPTITVAIPTYLREDVLVATIDQVLSLDPPPDELIVVDQTPKHIQKTDRYLKQKSDAGEIKWIQFSPPNLCAARNIAVINSTSDIILFLDDDVLLPPKLIYKHRLAHLEQGVAVVAGDVFHRISNDMSSLSIQTPTKGTIREPFFANISKKQIIGGFIGCHFSVNRRIFIEVGGFNESFVASANWEEGDFIARLLMSGGRILFDPDIWIIHLRAPAGGCRIPGNKMSPEWSKSANFFLLKFRYGYMKTWREVLHSALRSGPLRKENVIYLWRWPRAWAGFLYGIYYGWSRARKGTVSPFIHRKYPNSD